MFTVEEKRVIRKAVTAAFRLTSGDRMLVRSGMFGSASASHFKDIEDKHYKLWCRSLKAIAEIVAERNRKEI